MDKESIYICDVCKESQPSGNSSKSKIYCRVSSLESSFVCAKCSKLFSMAYEVTDNESLPDKGEEIFQLSIDVAFEDSVFVDRSCSKEEYAKSSQKDSKDKLYNCNICSKSFKHQCSFCQHMNKHKEKYKCKKCNKCLSSSYDLKMHMQLHSDQKPFKCRYCPKSFKLSGSLRHHSKLHTESNPFKCGLCNQKCTAKWYFKRHMLKHSNDRPHECDFCSCTFKRNDHLNRHIMKKHNQQYLLRKFNTVEKMNEI